MKLFTLFLFFFFFFSVSPVFAQTAERAVSNCVVTKVGNPAGQPILPPECPTTVIGIETPPNLGPCIPVPPENNGGVPGEYCKMPPSLNGAYTVGNTWGSKEIVSVLYTVAQNFRAKYPEGVIRIMDISAHHGPNSEHDWGVAVDLNATTNKKDCVSDMRHFTGSICTFGPYNQAATIELGKLFIDTGYFDITWFNDPVVNDTVFEYAKSKDPQKFTKNIRGKTGLRPQPGHYHHFHTDVDRRQVRSDSHSQNFFYSKLKKCQTVTPRVC